MDFDWGFREDDIKKTIQMMNMVSKHCKFNEMSQPDLIEFVNLLAHVQKNVLPKMEKHVLEFKKLHKAPENSDTKESSEE